MCFRRRVGALSDEEGELEREGRGECEVDDLLCFRCFVSESEAEGERDKEDSL